MYARKIMYSLMNDCVLLHDGASVVFRETEVGTSFDQAQGK